MVRVESVRIPAVRSGSPTLIFLHEGLGSLALWRGFPAALAERTGFGALVFSRRGNGFSEPLTEPRTPNYMHGRSARRTACAARRGADRRGGLVGHSDGASIALIFAAQHPERVRALVLEAPHVFVEDLSCAASPAIKQVYATTDLRERMARRHADGDATFYAWNDIWLAPAFRDWNIEAYVERVRAPVLVVQGADDEYGTLAQVESIAARAGGPVDG